MGVDFIVSVSNSQDKYYSALNGGFGTGDTTGSLISYAGSGVYSTVPGAMPDQVYGNSCYFRDVHFEPGTTRAHGGVAATGERVYAWGVHVTRGQMVVRMNGQGPTRVELLNAHGAVAFSREATGVGSACFGTRRLPRGVYMVRVSGGSGVRACRVVAGMQ